MSTIKPAGQQMAFFPHDASASQDPKIQRLMYRTGFAGYGRWWRLCEYLATANDNRFRFETEEDVCIISMILGFDPADVSCADDPCFSCKAFIDTLVDIDLLIIDDDGFLSSRRMTKHARYSEERRSTGARGGRPKKPTKADEKPDQ